MKIRDLKYQKAFGDHLKRMREERNWSQEQLSSVSNIDGFQISRIENGVHAPNLHTIRALAAALGRQPYELLKFDYAIKVNSDFSAKHRKRTKPGTSDFIRQLSGSNFFDAAKSVSEVISQVKKEFHANLKSAATSGVLAKLTQEKILRRMPASKSGHYLYIKRGK